MPRLTTPPPRMYRDRQWAYVAIDGQRIRLGRWKSEEAREAYDRTIAEWLAAGRKLPFPTAEDAPPTVTKIAVEYIRDARQRYDKQELVHIEKAVKLARRLYGSEPAEAFGPKRLRVVRQRMIDAGGLVRGTINHRIQRIRGMFRWPGWCTRSATPAAICRPCAPRPCSAANARSANASGNRTSANRSTPRMSRDSTARCAANRRG